MSLTVRQSRMLGTSDGAAATVAPAVLGLKTVRTSQPQGPVEIDWSNPITRGLIAAIDPVSGTNLISKANPTFSNATKSVTKNGVAKVTINNTSSYETYAFNRSTISNACSYFVLCDYALPDGGPSTFILGDVEASGVGYNAGLYSNSSYFIFFVKNTGGTGVLATSTTLSNIARPNFRLAGTYDGANVRVFVNGVSEGSNGQTGNVGAGAFSLNLNRWNSTDGFGISLNIGLVWNRALSVAEINSLSDNPWQIFRPATKQVWVAP